MNPSLNEEDTNAADHSSGKRAESLKQYTSRLLGDSLLTGVSPLVKTRSIPRKLLKTVALIFCFVGFIYQTTEFINIILTYPTVLDVQLVVPENYMVPALTVCNSDSFRRSAFCQKYPEQCETPSDMADFCKSYPHYCRRGLNITNFKIPKPTAYDFERNFTIEDMKKLGNRNFVYSIPTLPNDKVHLATVPLRYPKFQSFKEANPLLHVCYSFFSRVNSSMEPKGVKLPLMKDYPITIIELNFEPHEFFRPDRKPRAIFSVHSPFVAVNPYNKGFHVKPKKHYRVYVKQREEHRLPHPYRTNCTNYTREWIENGRRGVRSREMCVHACLRDQVSFCGCVFPQVLIPHEEKFCGKEEAACTSGKDMLPKYTRCFKECKQDCQSITFEYEVEEREIQEQTTRYDQKTMVSSMQVNVINLFGDVSKLSPATHLYLCMMLSELGFNERPSRSRSNVAVFIASREIVVLKHTPKYETIELFSYIGGYIGIWLGMSLVAVFDFLEIMGLIFSFYIQRLMRPRINTVHHT